MIKDQAEQLRILADQLKAEAPPARASAMRCIAIVSGKGGVGKTNLAVNLSILLSRSGKRVLLLDADWGLGNADTVLGISPKYTIQHFVLGEKELPDIIIPGPENLLLIANGSGMRELANLDPSQRDHILSSLANLEKVADIMVIDSGAGLSRNVLSFALAASEILVVTSPEPTAIRDAYATIKVISQENKDANISIVVNMVEDEIEAKNVAKRISNAANFFLDLNVRYLGYVVNDRNVQKAVSRRNPFITSYPYSPASKCLFDITRELGVSLPPKPVRVKDLFKRVSGVFQG